MGEYSLNTIENVKKEHEQEMEEILDRLRLKEEQKEKLEREISEKYQRGRHTTNHALWLEKDDIRIIDTPGVRELLVPLEDYSLLSASFPEFARCECAFSGCTHTDEPGCGVREAVEEEEIDFDRYESYLHMYESLKERSPQWARTKFRKNKQ